MNGDQAPLLASQDEFDALYEDMIDVATWARENGHQIAYDWIMDRFADWQNNEHLLPSGPLCWAASNDDVCRLPKPCPKHDLPQGTAGKSCPRCKSTRPEHRLIDCEPCEDCTGDGGRGHTLRGACGGAPCEVCGTARYQHLPDERCWQAGDQPLPAGNATSAPSSGDDHA